MREMEELSIFFSIGYSVLCIALLVLLIVSYWKVFEKAGEPGWAALIPFYNLYILYKIAGRKKMFWGVLAAMSVYIISYFAMIILAAFTLVGSLAYMFRSYGSYQDASFAGIVIGLIVFMAVFFIAMVVIAVLHGFMAAGIAKNFGQNGGFAVGLYLLPFVFYPILAFNSKIRYSGGMPMMPQYGYVPPQGYTPQPPQFGYVPPQGYAPQPPQFGYVPPQGYTPQPPQFGYVPPQGCTPQGQPYNQVPPQGYAPQGQPYNQVPSQGYAPQGQQYNQVPPQGYAPQGQPYNQVPPQGYMPQGQQYGQMPAQDRTVQPRMQQTQTSENVISSGEEQ